MCLSVAHASVISFQREAMATQELTDLAQTRMDHVTSVPVNLREMKAAQGPNQAIHRTEGNMHLNDMESDSQISESPEDQGNDLDEEDDDERTSELAQDVELLYELIDEKTREGKALKRFNRELKENVDELQRNLEEAKMIISEQQEQLSIYRQEVAISKSNVETLKLRNLALASNSKGATDEIRKMAEEYQDMRDELERLHSERRTMEAEMIRLQKQSSFLRKRGDNDHSTLDNGNGLENSRRSSAGRSRTTSNCSRALNSEEYAELVRLRNEGQYWQDYASTLARTIAEQNVSPHESGVSQMPPPPATTTNSNETEHWRSYTLRLLTEVGRNDPSKLTESDRLLLKQNNIDIRTLSRNNASSLVDGYSGDAVAIQTTSSAAGSEKQTRVNFAQTRRRKIDRLRDFFARKRRH